MRMHGLHSAWPVAAAAALPSTHDPASGLPRSAAHSRAVRPAHREPHSACAPFIANPLSLASLTVSPAHR